MVEVSEQPAKRVRMEQNNTSNNEEGPRKKNKYRPQRGRQSQGKNANRQTLVVSSSGIHNGDVGIFVTCDKGQEKKCLQELVDLLSEQFAHGDSAADGAAESTRSSVNLDRDIEADIQAELDSLRPKKDPASAPNQKLSCIELDIPCVSFVRFPSGLASPPDPVEVVRRLCTTAAQKDFQGPRSRYIKRLSPISLVRKTMADGLNSLCDELLPTHFLVEEEASTKPGPNDMGSPQSPGIKFAIRPTIRNNNKLDRDQVIQTVASKVETLGKKKHTVDLKGYDKLILIDVYRNIVGMSVVGSEFDTLKRFNLAEIHSSHFDET